MDGGAQRRQLCGVAHLPGHLETAALRHLGEVYARSRVRGLHPGLAVALVVDHHQR
jgi:hypothetical protein